MNIFIYAASSNALAPAFYAAAEELGSTMAQAGHTMIFGGGAGGLMGACAGGARKSGGKCIGVAPDFFDEPGVLLREGCELVFTESLAQRKAEMARLADAFIVLPGGIGTFEEFFETLTLRHLGRHRKPMALLNTLGYYSPLSAFLRGAAAEGFLNPDILDLFALCDTPAEALAHVSALPALHASSPSLFQYSP